MFLQTRNLLNYINCALSTSPLPLFIFSVSIYYFNLSHAYIVFIFLVNVCSKSALYLNFVLMYKSHSLVPQCF